MLAEFSFSFTELLLLLFSYQVMVKGERESL
jgi:hypothetical protein